MFMDRHDAPGVSPEELADLHTRDMEVQERHRVRYRTYWFDPANGSVFCLAEAPSKHALEAVHQEAHGQLAGTIIELDPNVPLNKFLGAPPEFPPGTPYERRRCGRFCLRISVDQSSRRPASETKRT
jgi:hypothetical protein